MKGQTVLTFTTLAMLLFLPMVFGDVEVYVGVDSDGGDIDSRFDLESDGGDISVLINGVDYEHELGVLQSTTMKNGDGFSSDSVYRMMSTLFMKWRYSGQTYKWLYTTPSDLNELQEKTKWIFDTYFVPRVEHDFHVQTLQNQITQLNLEIEVLEYIIGEDIYCSARIEVAKEHGIETVKCGDTKWHINDDGSVIGVTPKESEPIIVKKPVIENPVINDTIINGTIFKLGKFDDSCETNFDCPKFSGQVCKAGVCSN